MNKINQKIQPSLIIASTRIHIKIKPKIKIISFATLLPYIASTQKHSAKKVKVVLKNNYMNVTKGKNSYSTATLENERQKTPLHINKKTRTA